MLDADVTLEHGVVVVRYITRCVDPFHARPKVLVYHDAVVDLCAGASEELRNRLSAEAHHGEVAFDAATALGRDPLHAAGALERGHPILEDQLRPVIAVDVCDRPADLLAENPAQRHRVPVHDRDLHARLPE